MFWYVTGAGISPQCGRPKGSRPMGLPHVGLDSKGPPRRTASEASREGVLRRFPTGNPQCPFYQWQSSPDNEGKKKMKEDRSVLRMNYI